MKVLITYWSATGNTKKVAYTIEKALQKTGITPVMREISGPGADELYDYDLIFLGSPVYQFLPPKPVLGFIESKMKLHRQRGEIKPCAPLVGGKNAVVFCTYSGPHTGIREAIPAGEYIGQFFEHLGFNVTDKYYVVGEFHGHQDLSTEGLLGNILGRPNQEDLAEVANSVARLIADLTNEG